MIHGSRNHLYLIPENVTLNDSFAFSYGASMWSDVQNKRKMPLGDGDPLYMSDESDAGDYNVSSHSVTVDMAEEGSENNAMDV